MLVPVIVRANFKVTTSQLVTLETIAGSNLPLLFPELQVFNRTATTCALTISGQRSLLFSSQPDADFNGTVNTTLFSAVSLAAGQNMMVSGLGQSLTPTGYGVSTNITLANAGPAAEALVSLVLKGMVETSLQVDPLLIVNV
jgi:hypothetical protein